MYGLVAIPGKLPIHMQWNFLVSRNIFFGKNSTIRFEKDNRSGHPKEITVTVLVVGHTKIIMCSDGEGVIWSQFQL